MKRLTIQPQDHKNPKEREEYIKTELINEIKNGEIENVNQLINDYKKYQLKELPLKDFLNRKDKNELSILSFALNAASTQYKKDHIAIIKTLIENGGYVDERGATGARYPGHCHSALHIAAINNDIDFVKFLITLKAPFNIEDSLKQTALDYAFQMGHTELGKFLQDIGAEANIYDSSYKKRLDVNASNNAIDKQSNFNRPKEIQDYFNSKGIQQLLKGIDNGSINDVNRFIANYNKKPYRKISIKDLLNEQNYDYVSLFSYTLEIDPYSVKIQDHIEIIKTLIKSGADANGSGKNQAGGGRASPLHWAIRGNDINFAKNLIITNKVDVNIKDRYGKTPLHYAVESGKDELAKLLVKNEANIYANDVHGKTPLHYATDERKKTLRSCLDANTKDSNGKTPLNLAINNNKTKLALSLISAGANLNIEDKDGLTPLHYAVQNNQTEIVKALIEEGANVRYNAGDNLLHYAIGTNKTEIVKVLIEEGADVNAKDLYDQTPLHDAASYGDTKLIKTLIDKGADVNAKNKFKLPPLYFAMMSRKTENLKALIGNRADINVILSNGDTLLHFAASSDNQIENVKALIEARADVNAKNRYGQTPLHCAAADNQTEIVKALISKRVNLDIKDKNGLTPLHYAVQNNQTEIVKALIEARADVNAKNKDGKTPLHCAAADNQTEIVKALISKRVNLDIKDKNGLTPLHYAVQNNQIENVKVLIEAGADANAKNKDGKTPLDYATNGNESYNYLTEQKKEAKAYNQSSASSNNAPNNNIRPNTWQKMVKTLSKIFR